MKSARDDKLLNQLFRRALDEDAAAWSAIHDEVFSRLEAFLRRKFFWISASDGEEVASQAVTSLWKHKRALSTWEDALRYTHGAAQKLAWDIARGHTHTLSLSQEEVHPSDARSAASMEEIELADLLEAFEKRLRPDDARIWHALKRQDQTRDQLCRELAISRRTLERRVGSLRQRFAAHLRG